MWWLPVRLVVVDQQEKLVVVHRLMRLKMVNHLCMQLQVALVEVMMINSVCCQLLPNYLDSMMIVQHGPIKLTMSLWRMAMLFVVEWLAVDRLIVMMNID